MAKGGTVKVYTPKVGDYLEPDGWKIGEVLGESDGYSDSSYPGCEFRVRTFAQLVNLGVNLKVTGRALRYHGESRRIRVRVEVVGDGESSTFFGAWLYEKREGK